MVALGVLAGACAAPGATSADFSGSSSGTDASARGGVPGAPTTTSTTAAPAAPAPAPTTTSTTAPPSNEPPDNGGLVGGAGFSEGSSILADTDAELAQRLDGIAATGARWLRVDIRWPDVEQQAGTYRWNGPDRVINAASARGLQVLGILDFTPAWARPSGSTEKRPPSDPADYARFAGAAAQHYSGKVQAFEIWNEPNSPIFWEGGANPAAYTALLVPAYNAIKNVSSSFTVLTGGTAPGATGGGWYSPVDFLTGIYANGGRGHFDAVSHHGYHWPYMPLGAESNWNWNSFGGVTPHLHDVMVANGDGAKRIWITESGAPVTYTKNGVTTSPQYLADYVTEAFAAMRSWSWSGPLFLYSYRDRGTDPSDYENLFGLVTHDFQPKGPALAAFEAAVAA